MALLKEKLAAAIITVVLTIPTMDYDRREARVTYDDAQTTLGALTQATTDVGYPSFEADDPR
jgi:hypothetical protein